jgi:hypothetical protein
VFIIPSVHLPDSTAGRLRAEHGRLFETLEEFSTELRNDQDYCYADQHEGVERMSKTFARWGNRAGIG